MEQPVVECTEKGFTHSGKVLYIALLCITYVCTLNWLTHACEIITNRHIILYYGNF